MSKLFRGVLVVAVVAAVAPRGTRAEGSPAASSVSKADEATPFDGGVEDTAPSAAEDTSAVISSSPGRSDAGVAARRRVGTLPSGVNGYQDLLWGMRLEEVRKRMPGLEENSSGVWVKETVVADFPAFIGLTFKNGKLKKVVIQFARDIPRGLSKEEQSAAIVKALTKKYGIPKKEASLLGETPSWSNDQTAVEAYDNIHGFTVSYESHRLMKEVEEVSTDGL
ncbi:MAG: hypothetical protein EOO71_24045 [Myxococcaceae bacterium]|nr:MAG: hypothetical protein EOO71_24045 [Myxococcaceae bacterium]